MKNAKLNSCRLTVVCNVDAEREGVQSDLISLQASDQGAHTSRSPLQPSRTGFVSLFGPSLPRAPFVFALFLSPPQGRSLLFPSYLPLPFSVEREAPPAPLTFVNLNCFSLMNARPNRRNQTIRDRRLMGVNSKMNLKGLSSRTRSRSGAFERAFPLQGGMKCNRERILLMEITRVVGTEELDS